MNLNLTQFKQDFLIDNLLPVLQKGFEVIFIWVAGSTITGLADSSSDIDLGVLILNNNPVNRNEDYLIYKPTGSKIQWIYDTIADITSLQPEANQRNIGWAQLRCLSDLSDPAILYVNPKYQNFVKELLSKKDIISKYNMWLYTQDKAVLIKHILNAGGISPECQVKSLYHLCWAANSLLNKPQDKKFLRRLKHAREIPLDKNDLQKAFKKIYQLNSYFKSNIPQKPELSLKEDSPNVTNEKI